VLNVTGEGAGEVAVGAGIARPKGRAEGVMCGEEAQQEEEGDDEVDLEALDAVEQTEEAIERSWGGRENVPAGVLREWREEMLWLVRARRQ
jgi:hypothetical protein